MTPVGTTALWAWPFPTRCPVDDHRRFRSRGAAIPERFHTQAVFEHPAVGLEDSNSGLFRQPILTCLNDRRLKQDQSALTTLQTHVNLSCLFVDKIIHH
jgi:hypothetical protein